VVAPGVWAAAPWAAVWGLRPGRSGLAEAEVQTRRQLYSERLVGGTEEQLQLQLQLHLIDKARHRSTILRKHAAEETF